MAERYEIVEKALLKMLDEKKYSALREVLSTMNPSDIAVVLSNLEEDRCCSVCCRRNWRQKPL